MTPSLPDKAVGRGDTADDSSGAAGEITDISQYVAVFSPGAFPSQPVLASGTGLRVFRQAYQRY